MEAIMEKILEVKNLYKNFEAQEVLRDINFSLKKGEILSILGESGCGKSTLLGSIAGFFPITQGEILIHNTLIASKQTFLPPQKRDVGLVFQDYALFPHLNIKENILFGITHLPSTEQTQRFKEIIDIFQLQDHLKKYPHELSGGQAQRVGLARTMITRPAIILFDEPFSNLNHTLSIQLRSEIKQVIKEHQLTVIFVTHDKEDVFFLADNLILMHQGQILEYAPPHQIYHNPKTLQSALFLGEINTIQDIHCIKSLYFKNWLIQKNLMFRPKDIQISNTPTELQATVIENLFWGDWFEIKVELDSHIFTLHSQFPYEIGTQIFLILRD